MGSNKFSQTWDLQWEAKNYMNFHFRLFLGRSHHKSFEQKQQNTVFWDRFYSNMGKNESSLKLGLCQFLNGKNFNYMQKIRKR